MNDSIITGDIRQQWKSIPIADVIVRERQRKLNEKHVAFVRQSFKDLGGQLLLQPIVVDADLILIDGRHRLEAARLEGWEFIPALVLEGAASEDRALLEAEANRVRLQLSPLELEDAWTKYYIPAFKARAKKAQLEGLKRGSEAPVIGNSNNGERSVSMSLPTAAKQATGYSLETINKITDIRTAAQSTTLPEEIREAAVKGLQKLQRPNASVDPIHKSLLQMQDRLIMHSEDPSEVQRRLLEKRLDQTLSDTTLLQEKLGGDLGRDLLAAASSEQITSEQLRAIRIALVHATAYVVAIECNLGGDPAANLEQIGAQTMRMLSEQSTKALGMEVDHG